MPRRKDLKKIVIFGSGPIVVGQACEFDYSGTQACKALTKEGYEVILVNSNPATVMTDPDMADKVYVEPLEVEFVEKILRKERPCGVISTLGGQTALNLALELHEKKILEELDIELLGANVDVIRSAEDRKKFNEILRSVGAKHTKSAMVTSFKEGMQIIRDFQFPVILRPNYTLGGGGGGVCFSFEEYRVKLALGLEESPTSEVLVEQSILGWYEYELEVMRDKDGVFVVICSIENLDPCGVHTGDSITVAPQQTLSDLEYQQMRNEAQKIVNAVGVETGGSNIQFAVHPKTRERVVIEMNPRVSRSSALASKATGFPIAKIAALLSVGYRLEEIKNDITKTTLACYEPALDYVVTKIPFFNFHKFTNVKDELTTQMRSIGEAMGIGRTFKESLQKTLMSLEKKEAFPEVPFEEEKLSYPNSIRMFHIYEGFKRGISVSEMNQKTLIHPWFLEQIQDLTHFEKKIKEKGLDEDNLLQGKKLGFSDVSLARFSNKKTKDILKMREKNKIFPYYFQVDTCAGEFAAETPYYYSSYQGKGEQDLKLEKAVVVLGSGPNRIGQGVEFDYSCVRGVKKLQEEGHPVIMINSNPETVSTDYDTSNLLFFEPLVEEHVLEVLRAVKPEAFVAQLGGQTPIHLAPYLVKNGYKLLGSSLKSIDLAEDRKKFNEICRSLDFQLPLFAMVGDIKSAKKEASQIGYPIICRPSYVLGGRRMEIIETEKELEDYFKKHKDTIRPDQPCLMDQFLERALEVDVDLVRGKNWSLVGGIVEHIETAGIHSGDSMGVLPPQKLKKSTCEKIEQMSLKMAEKLQILGLLNLQLAVKNDEIFILEANPRGSRSLPFVCKSNRVPLLGLSIKAMLGHEDVDVSAYKKDGGGVVCVKGVVFPFKKFPEADTILGPEMKSTGESMGRGKDYSEALLKAFVSSHYACPPKGEIFLSLRDKDKKDFLELVPSLQEMGFSFVATKGTHAFLRSHEIPCELIKKVHEGRPHCVDRIRSKKIQFVINTTSGRRSIDASFGIRRSCIDYMVPCLTDINTAKAFCYALKKHSKKDFDVHPLPKYQ